MADITQAIALYATIEKAIKHNDGTKNLLNAYINNNNRQLAAFKKHNRKMHKLFMRWLRIKIRLEKGLNVHDKGGTLLYSPKTKAPII